MAWPSGRGLAAAAVALAVAGTALIALGLNGAARDELLVAKAKTQKLADAQQRQFAVYQGQQLPQYEVGGVMSTDDGPQPPATQQMSFEFPVEIPGAPPPPGPNIITVGPRPKKVPICKECVKQRKMIQKLVNLIEHDNDRPRTSKSSRTI